MKLSRTHIRELLFLLLFRKEYYTMDEMEDQIQLFFERLQDLPDSLLKSMRLPLEDSEISIPAEKEYIENKLHRILDKVDELDETIGSISQGWRLNRLGRVELTILRLAVFEIQDDPDVPTGVAINEAVVLAKKYSGEDSSRFVNGVLAKLA